MFIITVDSDEDAAIVENVVRRHAAEICEDLAGQFNVQVNIVRSDAVAGFNA